MGGRGTIQRSRNKDDWVWEHAERSASHPGVGAGREFFACLLRMLSCPLLSFAPLSPLHPPKPSVRIYTKPQASRNPGPASLTPPRSLPQRLLRKTASTMATTPNLISYYPTHNTVAHAAFRCAPATAPGAFALEHDLDDPGAQVRTVFAPNPARGAFFIAGRSRLRHGPFVRPRARRPVPEVGLEGRRWSDGEGDFLGRKDWPAAWKARCAVQRPPRWLRGVEGGSEDEGEGDDEGDGGPAIVKRGGRRRCVPRSGSSGEESSSDASRTFESWSRSSTSRPGPRLLGLDRLGWERRERGRWGLQLLGLRRGCGVGWKGFGLGTRRWGRETRTWWTGARRRKRGARRRRTCRKMSEGRSLRRGTRGWGRGSDATATTGRTTDAATMATIPVAERKATPPPPPPGPQPQPSHRLNPSLPQQPPRPPNPSLPQQPPRQPIPSPRLPQLHRHPRAEEPSSNSRPPSAPSKPRMSAALSGTSRSSERTRLADRRGVGIGVGCCDGVGESGGCGGTG